MSHEYAWSTTFTAEAVDELWPLIFGNAPTTYEAILTIPAKRRTFWEWLTRKPLHLERRIIIPNARLTTTETKETHR